MSDLFKLDGKIALVMGGAGGIGRGISIGMSQNGATVVVADMVDMEVMNGFVEEIKSATGNDAMGHQVDVTSEESMSKLVQDVVDKFGTIDILVNAFGLNIKREALEFPVEDWDKIFSVNVKGTMISCKHIGRVMKEKKQGSIINLSSVRGIRGYGGGNAGYAATKGSVQMITKCLAIELAPYNVRVNAIGPSLVITPGTIHIQQNPELAKKYEALIPLGRLGQPEDMAGTAVFLASEASSFITGQTIFVDGGLTAS
jgi:NAD(P)-dependent dehydrogenase (short-subunit alcohol dehydrogenase family)